MSTHSPSASGASSLAVSSTAERATTTAFGTPVRPSSWLIQEAGLRRATSFRTRTSISPLAPG